MPAPLRLWAALALLAMGLLIVVLALPKFRRAATPVRPDRPSTALISGGPYRFSRNPLYVALTLAYLGLAVALDSLWVLALLVPVLATMQVGVVAREERYLEAKFGDEYRAYKQTVRRWL
ncbi:MAG: isoprenylcysteine carboxylmethyltransferase family protein [Alphaproteobacteria bacterium]|nr:isoprenylcysteine carboxylmethyltransferase family protein [Alphaproteobacteria bacterium]